MLEKKTFYLREWNKQLKSTISSLVVPTKSNDDLLEGQTLVFDYIFKIANCNGRYMWNFSLPTFLPLSSWVFCMERIEKEFHMYKIIL